MISLKERFLSKVQMAPSGCCEWTGHRDHGYGILIIGGKYPLTTGMRLE